MIIFFLSCWFTDQMVNLDPDRNFSYFLIRRLKIISRITLQNHYNSLQGHFKIAVLWERKFRLPQWNDDYLQGNWNILNKIPYESRHPEFPNKISKILRLSCVFINPCKFSTQCEGKLNACNFRKISCLSITFTSKTSNLCYHLAQFFRKKKNLKFKWTIPGNGFSTNFCSAYWCKSVLRTRIVGDLAGRFTSTTFKVSSLQKVNDWKRSEQKTSDTLLNSILKMYSFET